MLAILQCKDRRAKAKQQQQEELEERKRWSTKVNEQIKGLNESDTEKRTTFAGANKTNRMVM